MIIDIQPNMPTIVPMLDNEALTKKWRMLHESMLQNIVREGRYVPDYEKNCAQRCWHGTTLVGCSVLCCGPCCIWDTACGTCYACCGCAGRFGLFFNCFAQSCDEMMRDKNMVIGDMLRENKTRLYAGDVRAMCRRYIAEYDVQLSAKTANGARAANCIREKLTDIIRLYSPSIRHVLLRDNGDMDRLRNIVEKDWF